MNSFTLTVRGLILVCRRQILTTKVDPRPVRVERQHLKIFGLKLKKNMSYFHPLEKVVGRRSRTNSTGVGELQLFNLAL